jgi:peptidoglycan/LPS O-acetylase OafA/YrhL
VQTLIRNEIAGLRAVAVISVVLFHLKVGGFEGGFVGVDVFFVISGYLISRNILRDLRVGRFSIGDFYVRRVRRIYPALIFTVVATYLCGALWCAPDMFHDLAKESTHALLSISNIQYWRESQQYFAAKSDELALLHCWSLSLEEQFYLFWPVFIVFAWRRGRIFQIIAAAAVTSFFLSVIVAKADPLAAFFLMPFRIFEFGIGALVLFLETRVRLGKIANESISAAGLAGVIASVLLFKSDLPHLDVAYLLPCMGAAATIWANDQTKAAKIITSPVMVGIGAISYSLYLCHWPIIFFARFIFGDEANSLSGVLTMAVVMIAVATAMYFLIERRFIRSSEIKSAGFLKNAAVFWSVVLALAAITHTTFLSKGFAWRLPEAQVELAHLQDFPSGRDLEPVNGPVGVQLVGDSLATQYIAGLSPFYKQLNIRLEALGGAGCPILYGAALKALRREECLLARDEALKRLSETNLPIIHVQKWGYYDDATIDYEFESGENLPPRKGSFAKLGLAIERTLQEFIERGHRVLLIGDQVSAGCAINRPRLLQGPLLHAPQPPCPARTREVVEQSTASMNQMLSSIQAKWPDKVQLLRPVDYFCDKNCPVVKDEVWFYFDNVHFTVAGSSYMVTRSADVFRNFLRARDLDLNVDGAVSRFEGPL